MRSRRITKLLLFFVLAILLALVMGVLWIRLHSTEAVIRSTADRASTPDAPAVSELAVRVAAYNAWLLPIGSDALDERREAMGPAIDALALDVLCLQEVWTESTLEPLAEQLSDRLPDVATSGGGLAVLSRWAIRDAVFDEFPSGTAPSPTEWLARKGFLSVVIETPAGLLRVVNTHLAFDRSEEREGHGQQLAILVEALRDGTDLPTVLCGDLNLRAREDGLPTEGFAAILDTGFEDVASVGPDGRPAERQPTRVGWPRAGRRGGWDPDYLMVRSGDAGTLSIDAFSQALDTEQTALSDHNLLVADFVLRPTPPR